MFTKKAILHIRCPTGENKVVMYYYFKLESNNKLLLMEKRFSLKFEDNLMTHDKL